MTTTPIRPPRFSLLALEGLAVAEFGLMTAASPVLALAKAGDGHPVLVLPAFIANDASTRPLRRALGRKGHRMYGWNLGFNTGPHERLYGGAERLIQELADRHGAKVSLVGWSLGGLMARELARTHGEYVRSVITLASPFRLRAGDGARASKLYRLLAPYDERFVGHIAREQHRPPLDVPATSIYTRTDGISRWHTCIGVDSPTSENIEVYSTHCGLMFNVPAVVAIADRLAQPEGEWRRFEPPAVLRPFYPRPASWQEADVAASIDAA
jgi:pimeloyl-ACP methyl ester carboxylesterase